MITTKIKKQSHKDAFNCTYSAGKFHIEADNESAERKAKYQLEIARKSSFHHSAIGSWQPRFPLRTLWLKSACDTPLTSHVAVSLPTQFSNEHAEQEKVCQRIVELGYNVLILGHYESSFVNTPMSATANSVERCISIIKQHGLQLFIKPLLSIQKNQSRCPCDPLYNAFITDTLKELIKKMPQIDGIFWESHIYHPECYRDSTAKDMTQKDLIQAELAMLEKALGKEMKLIFYIPTPKQIKSHQQSHWFSSITHAVGNNTTIAFSSALGAPWEDYGQENPLWTTLKASQDHFETPLMPILNLGGIRQGDGLWPTLPFHSMDSMLSQSTLHNFVGPICLAPNIPAKGSLLECALWASAQNMWNKTSFLDSVETWFHAYYPDIDFKKITHALLQMSSVGRTLNYLRSINHEKHRDEISNEECRAMAESLLFQLRHMEQLFQQFPKENRLKQYVTLFSRDAQRYIVHFMHLLHLPVVHLKQQEDLEDGFWTRATIDMSRNTKYTFLDLPNAGPLGSIMNHIYQETTSIKPNE